MRSGSLDLALSGSVSVCENINDGNMKGSGHEPINDGNMRDSGRGLILYPRGTE